MRVTRGFVAKNRRKRVLKLAKGFRGAHSSQYRVAQQSVLKALSLAYNHRRLKKRNFRSLWIRRINSALVVEGVGLGPLDGPQGYQPSLHFWSPSAIGSTNPSRPRPLSYSLFINSLKKYQTTLNRKVLSQLAIFDPKAFQILVRQVNS